VNQAAAAVRRPVVGSSLAPSGTIHRLTGSSYWRRAKTKSRWSWAGTPHRAGAVLGQTLTAISDRIQLAGLRRIQRGLEPGGTRLGWFLRPCVLSLCRSPDHRSLTVRRCKGRERAPADAPRSRPGSITHSSVGAGVKTVMMLRWRLALSAPPAPGSGRQLGATERLISWPSIVAHPRAAIELVEVIEAEASGSR